MTDQASSMRHTENKVDETHAAHHIVSSGIYLTSFLVLLVLTVLTVVVAYFNFGGLWNLVIALGIATLKALIVVLWFMHVRYSGRLIQLTIVASLLFFGLLIFGTLMDVWTRNNVTMAEHSDQYALDKAELESGVTGDMSFETR